MFLFHLKLMMMKVLMEIRMLKYTFIKSVLLVVFYHLLFVYYGY